MDFTLRVWRQKNSQAPGRLETHEVRDIAPEMSFLEMLDVLNRELITEGQEPIAFDHDCREGICGACSLVINGIAHGPDRGTTACQLYMRRFKHQETITIEPFRATPFPLVRDLVVDRSTFDRIQQSGGFVSVNTGGAPDANALPIAKEKADRAMDAAVCIGCGACVAACKNASASLFTAAKVAHLAHLPQGQPERYRRVKTMVTKMDEEGFGSCTNTYDCEAVCPQEISVQFIAQMNWDYLKAILAGE